MYFLNVDSEKFIFNAHYSYILKGLDEWNLFVYFSVWLGFPYLGEYFGLFGKMTPNMLK